MGLARKLFINWHKRTRQFNDKSADLDVVDRLTFRKYEKIPFEICLVEPDTTRSSRFFSKVDITDLSLEVAINDSYDDSTPLAQQTSWTKDTTRNVFIGSLDLATAAMNTYVGSSERSPYFEIKITDTLGNRVPVLVEVCTIGLPVQPITTVSPDPLDVFYTAAQSDNRYLRGLNPNAQTITLSSPNGLHHRVLGIRDDGTNIDDYY